MKNRNPALLSHLPIEREDLNRLLRLAEEDRAQFFAKYPEWRDQYQARLLGVALCQGAADHYLDRSSGINDFDVYTFYAEHPARRWYAKRLQAVDFGDPKFGQSEVSRRGFVGRRVDLLGRALPVEPGADIVLSLQAWLASGLPGTARELAVKSVVLLSPAMGVIVWPMERKRAP